MPRMSAAAWSFDSIVAVTVAAMAMAGSFGALLHARHADWLLDEIEVQTVVTEAYQGRAMHCLDQARSLFDTAEHRRQAQMSLDLSKGITLCLVQSREQARLEVDVLAACTRAVEAANTVLEITPDGSSELRPVC